MEINFDAELPDGTVTFKGVLSHEEVDFLLRFAILSLMARGTLPIVQGDVPNPVRLQ
mgnify:FL=1